MLTRQTTVAAVVTGLIFCGCATSDRIDYLPFHAHEFDKPDRYAGLGIDSALEDRILGLDPENVSEADIRGVLATAPAPRIIGLHGGIRPVYRYMVSFGRFLEGMGYPADRLRNPRDGTYSFSGYLSSKKIAGAVAWYYEREGLRPMIIGHSLGGFQTVRVLRQLAGLSSRDIPVWSPLTRCVENRCSIIDPITAADRPVVGLELSYAAALGAGGLSRVLPYNWTVTGCLRDIPDSAKAFTGYYAPLDFLGSDLLGFGPANHYRADAHVTIRNVELPALYPHCTLPATAHLLESREIIDWINSYQPTEKPRLRVKFEANAAHILWAADVWHDIKKHWVLELQRVIRAEREHRHEH
jgi:hypothetical protein